MSGWHDENQFVQIHNHGVQTGFLRFVGQHAEFGGVPQDIIGNVAAE